MNPIVWKDLKVLARRKGTLILALVITAFLSVTNGSRAAHDPDYRTKLASFLSYYAIFLPIMVGYMISTLIFAMDIGERSIEALFGTPLSPQRILIGKALVVAFLSWFLGGVALAAGMLSFWWHVRDLSALINPAAVINLLLAFPLVFGLYGLAGVGFWPPAIGTKAKCGERDRPWTRHRHSAPAPPAWPPLSPSCRPRERDNNHRL